MPNISKIKGPDGTVYNLKDTVAANELADAKGDYESFADRLDGYDTTFGKVSTAIQGLIDTRIEPPIETNIRLTKSAGGRCIPNLNMVIKNTWSSKTWTGLTEFSGGNIWTDGENIYYSNRDSTYATTGDYVLNKSTSTWSEKTWSGFLNIYGHSIWTDGENVYYSNSNSSYGTVGNYVLNDRINTTTNIPSCSL